MVVRPRRSCSAAYHQRPLAQSKQRYTTANVSKTTKTLCPMNTLISSLHQVIIYNTHLLQPRSTLKSMVVAACVSASRLSLLSVGC
ncbi:hypothetical protein M405DRAFT_631167 [Rhizopogon salebrosus TDB-379]|nr:hypothetical protein M405DRAFT_631167 [Rhizopogon salebrosus TDB-379]